MTREDYAAFREAVATFVQKRVTTELIDDCESNGRPPLELLAEVAAQGWLSVGLPVEHGGADDYLATAILLEELSKGYMALGDLAYRCLIHGARNIIAHGSDHLKQELLPQILEGKLLFVNGISEPDSGADAGSITSTAVRDGDDFVINGHKIWNTGMGFCDYVVCYVRTDPTLPKHRGISAILVPTNSAGIEMRRMNTVGYKATSTYEVWYDDVRVPATNLLGELNGGWAVMMGHLGTERMALSAIAAGCCRDILEKCVRYASERKQFGQPVGNFQAVSHMIADIQVLTYTTQVVALDFARVLNEGGGGRIEASSVKLHCSEAYKLASDLGVQIFGAYGYVFEAAVNRHWRDARVFTIGAGSSQIQRNIIAKSLGFSAS